MPNRLRNTPLPNEIRALVVAFDEGNIDWLAYSENALLLSARKLDGDLPVGSEPRHERALADQLQSPSAAESYEAGERGLPARKIGSGINPVKKLDGIQSLIERQFGEGYTPDGIIQRLFPSGNSRNVQDRTEAITRQELPDELEAIFMVALLGRVAEEEVHAQYTTLLDTNNRRQIPPENTADFWATKVDKVKRNTAFAQKALSSAQVKAEELYGADGARIMSIFDAIVMLRANTFNRSDRGPFRNAVLQKIKESNLTEAERIITDLIQQHPASFTGRARKLFS